MNDIAGIADAVRASTTSEQPVDVPGASGYQVHSKAYFDGPLDRDRITMLSQVMSLFVLTEGDPNAPEHFLREDHLEINDEIFRYEYLSRNFGGVSDLPAEGEETTPASPRAPRGRPPSIPTRTTGQRSRTSS